MRLSLLLLLFICIPSFAQPTPFNRLMKVHVGMTSEQLDHYRYAKAINDTGDVQLDYLSWSPSVSYTHEFALGQILSVSGNIGFQYLNLYYGNQHYGAPYFYASINPQVSVFYRRKFEYYVKLRVGATFYIHNPDIIPDPARRLMPETVNMFTGITLGGFNYFITDKFGLNLELSVWSPELATLGFSYRFFKGELPEVQNNKNDL
jgi:hypothetical protein